LSDKSLDNELPSMIEVSKPRDDLV